MKYWLFFEANSLSDIFFSLMLFFISSTASHISARFCESM